MENVVEITCAQSGASHRVPAGPADSVETLRFTLQTLCGIPPPEQILLTERGAKLESSKPLAAYSKEPVYVFDRRALSSDVPLPVEPPPPPLGRSVSTDRVTPPLTLDDLEEAARLGSEEAQALLEAESTWRARAERVDELSAQAAANVAACEGALQAAAAQERAVGAAAANLLIHVRQSGQSVAAFASAFARRLEEHERVSARLEEDLAQLASVEVHPALQAGGQRTLLDFVGADRVRALARDCGALLGAMRPKAAALEESAAQLRAAAEAEPRRPWPVPREALEASLGSLRGAAAGLAAARAAAVRRHGRACAGAAALLSGMPEEAGGAEADREAEAEAAFLQAEAAAAAALADVPPAFAAARDGSRREAHARLRSVSALQSRIRDLGHRTALLAETLERHGAPLSELAGVAGLPSVYRAAVEEVARRRRHLRRFAALVEALAEGLGRVREDELLRRERFHQQYGRALPPSLLGGGLLERPPVAHVSVPSLHTSLPALEEPPEGGYSDSADDLDLHALIGPCPRCSARPPTPPPPAPDEPSPAPSPLACPSPSEVAPAGSEFVLRVAEGEEERERLARANAELQRSLERVQAEAAEERERLAQTNAELQRTVERVQAEAAEQRRLLAQAQADLARLSGSMAEQHEAFRKRVTPAYANLFEACKRYREACAEVAAAAGAHAAVVRQGEGVEEVDTRAVVEAVRRLGRDEAGRGRAALRGFREGDLAVFVHQPGRSEYMAAHVGAPDVYLAEECIQTLRPDERMPFFVARIARVQPGRAQLGPGGNPYGLRIGSPFLVVAAGPPDI